jgi:hypothetical protein
VTGCLKFISWGRMGQHEYHEHPLGSTAMFSLHPSSKHMQQLGNSWKYCSPSNLVRVYIVAVVVVAVAVAAVVVVLVAV